MLYYFEFGNYNGRVHVKKPVEITSGLNRWLVKINHWLEKNNHWLKKVTSGFRDLAKIS